MTETSETCSELPAVHTGAIDQSMVTSMNPATVIQNVTKVLDDMGIEFKAESTYKYRCVRPRSQSLPQNAIENEVGSTPYDHEGASNSAIYGEKTEDPGDEVRFTVEVSRLNLLKAVYSLDIRRLKGNLRSYKFLYDMIRERVNLPK